MAAEDTWEGKASAKVEGVSPDKVWAAIDDYAHFYKYFPSLDTTTIESGEPGKLGCVRLCSGDPLPGSQERAFTNEKLVAYNPVERTLSYEVLENNIGFKDYVATLKVLPEEDGSTIEWSFTSSPMPPPGWSVEKITGYISFCANYMAGKIVEEAKA
ncbi:lachrymatory-factor synthase-like [Aristolochia californica]|uniref:lachrymatory-factor synthase-like n=1 Tax=Aristolochia californica TaxID=171875 RepID=UPI0035D699FC